TQGGPPAIIVRGNRDALAKVRYGHGRLAGYNVYNCFIGFLCDDGRDERPLDVEVRGVALNEIDISGVADVRLGHIEQDRLTLHISGAGAARGEGRLNSLDLSVSGAGHVGLAGLAVGSAKVVLSGAGSAEIAPSGSADVTISGVGSVRLATKPENLVTNISGMGSVTGPGIQRSRGHHHDQEEHVSNELDREIRDQVRAQIQAQNIPEKVKQKVEEKLKDTGLTAESPPVPPPPPR
ncbi:MAG TPA: DUF2807 domain-containing protein, partial [Rhizomicrobium sp.]|nr:DUF2807 domain-containing protein [Rhizomicrobium sp.]